MTKEPRREAWDTYIARALREHVQGSCVHFSADAFRTILSGAFDAGMEAERNAASPEIPAPRIAWQCSGCGWGFPDPWQRVCPACGRRDYWTGSIHPEAKLWPVEGA